MKKSDIHIGMAVRVNTKNFHVATGEIGLVEAIDGQSPIEVLVPSYFGRLHLGFPKLGMLDYRFNGEWIAGNDLEMQS